MVHFLKVVFAILISSSCVYGMNSQSELSSYAEVPSLKDLAASRVIKNINNLSCDQLEEIVVRESLYNVLPEELSTLIVQKSSSKDRQFMYSVTGINFSFDTAELEQTNQSCAFWQQNPHECGLFLCDLDQGVVVAYDCEAKFEDVKYSPYGNKLLVKRSRTDYAPIYTNDKYDLLNTNLEVIKLDIFNDSNFNDVNFCCGDSMFLAKNEQDNYILIDDEGNIHREARLLQCSSDGSTLLIGNFKKNRPTDDFTCEIIVEQNGRVIASFEALNVKLSGDGKKVILQNAGQCILYDLVSNEQKDISSLVDNSRLYEITFNANGKTVLLSHKDGSYLIDLDSLHAVEFCINDHSIKFILGGEYIEYMNSDWARHVIAVADLFSSETGTLHISSFFENKALISLGNKEEPSLDLVNAINEQCDLHNNIKDLEQVFNLKGINREAFSPYHKTILLCDDENRLLGNDKKRCLISRCSDSLTLEQYALKKLIEKQYVNENYINNKLVKDVYDLFSNGQKQYLIELMKLKK